MATVGSILSDVALRLPHSTVAFTDSVKVGWMNDLQNEVWRYAASTKAYSFQLTSGVTDYAMATDMAFDKIKYVALSDSTVNTSTALYTEYPYVGPQETLGNNYSKAWGSTIGDILLPIPTTSGYFVKVIYENKPVVLTTSATDVPSLNSEFHDIYKFRVMKVISQAGNNPDIELANNYQLEEDSMLKKIRMDYHNRNFRKPRDTYRRSEGWSNG